MSVYLLDEEEIWFPPSHEYEFDLVAVGGTLTPERVLKAYNMGIFPWYNEPDMPEWFCPVERCVFYPATFIPSKSLQQAARKQKWTYTTDKCFTEVIKQCSANGREGNTWILPDIISCYVKLHELGYAHSVEVWSGAELVGGLYGMAIGNIFCGESMFSHLSNASKYAFITFVQQLKTEGVSLVDCQVYTEHLESLGARHIPRDEFMSMINALC
jgi:leucyl/phenylalanyl-tRNA--protein transferase